MFCQKMKFMEQQASMVLTNNKPHKIQFQKPFKKTQHNEIRFAILLSFSFRGSILVSLSLSSSTMQKMFIISLKLSVYSRVFSVTNQISFRAQSSTGSMQGGHNCGEL